MRILSLLVKPEKYPKSDFWISCEFPQRSYTIFFTILRGPLKT